MVNLNEFKNYLISCSKSENTISSYISDLEQYFSQYSTLSRDNILKYKNSLSGSASTINRKLTSLKQYNEYLLSTKQIDGIYILKEDFIKQQSKGNPTDVTTKQVEKFLERVLTKDVDYKSRNIAIIFLIANTGIRRSECCNLLLKNIDLENNEMIVIGKGNKERTVLLTDKVVELIKNYLVDRNKSRYKDSPYLFVSERGNKLCPETINDIFDYYSTPKNKIRPHQLRHNYASIVVENNILTLPELQNQLGHSNINTTGLYTHARKDTIKKKINKLCIGY
jgi:integrase/recombinase XerD